MGKSKPRHRTKNRLDPTGKPKPPSDPELAALRDAKILPVLQDLQSAELKKRSVAASAITNLIEDTKCRKLLLREQIVRILLEQTLTDLSLETRTAGWGILRNLALEEEADLCIHLYRQDILTAIEGAVKTIVQTIESQDTPLSKLPKAQQELLWNITSSIVNLLSSLSEAQEEIVAAITKLSTITNFLFGLLSLESPDEVQNEALSCLAALTEDNEILVKQIAEHAWLNKLLELKDARELKAVAACGVLHNVFATMKWYDHNTPMQGVTDAILIPILVGAMEGSHGSHVMETNGANGSHSNPDQILQLALDITASIATSLQEAIEHGSKNEKEFEGFDMDDKDDEMNDLVDGSNVGDVSEENEEMDEDEIDADMDVVLGEDAEDGGIPDDQVTLETLVRTAAPVVLTIAGSTRESGPIQSAALSALNNIAWTLSSIDFSTGNLNSLQKFWTSFSQRMWNEVVTPVLSLNTADVELASSVTSIAWAVARSVQGEIKIQPEEQRKFMSLYHASKNLGGTNGGAQTNGHRKTDDDDDAFQSLGVKCIGVLGRLGLNPAPVSLNREIGLFLLTTLSTLPDTPAAEVIEALDSIFDIYADKSYGFDEAVFWGDGLYTHLEEILPKSKQMAKKIDKRKFPELRVRADEAVLNLGRFLKYKKTERDSKDGK